MDKVSEILDNIKDRFSNPLIFSFVCAWLVFNWEIIIALLWYDTKQINAEGFVSIFEFISNKLSNKNSISYPVIFCLLYTFILPLFKIVISGFYTWTTRLSDDLNLKLSKGGKVSIDKYMSLREDYTNRTKILEDVIAKESSFIEENHLKGQELLSLGNEFNNLKMKLMEKESFISLSNDRSMLDGLWICTFETNGSPRESQEIQINNGEYFIIKNFAEKELVFKIQNFKYNPNDESIFFVKRRITKDAEDATKIDFRINELHVASRDLLSGRENNTTRIDYKRKE